MALPDKRLPLIHYDTKDEYEAKVAAMTTEERAQYDAFYLGFVADTREFHTQGNTYKCSRGWVLSDITGAQAGANEFVSNVCAGDTLLMSNNELVLLMGKTLDNNIITVTALSPSGGYLLTFSTDDNGANWHLSATIPRSFVQAELMYGTSAMMAEMGGIYETESGCVIAFPSSSQEVKYFADYTLQEEITDLEDIRSGANKGTQAMERIESGDLTARDLVGRAEPTTERFSFRASAGSKSIRDESAVIRRILGNTLYTNWQYRGMSISAIKTVGFNIINTATAISGVFDSSGAIVPNDHYSIATARVLPGEAYYFRKVCNGNYYPTYVVYNAAGTVLNVGHLTGSDSNASGYVTMPSDAYSVKIAYRNADVNECCANISHTGIRDGEYEPYEEHILHIPEIRNYFPSGLWQVFNIYDELTPTEAIQRIGHIDLGALEYTYNEDVEAFEAYIGDIAPSTLSVLTDYFDTLEVSEGNSGVEDLITSCSGKYIRFREYSFADDTEDFRAAMSGEILHYELETPIITKISTPLQLSYWVEDFGTEEAISDGLSAPFVAEIVYKFNAVDRIRDNERNILRLEEYLNSRDNVAAQPYIVKSGIAANGGKVSDNAASIKALRGDTVVWNQYANITNFTAIAQYGVTVSYDNGKLLCRGIYTGGEDKNFYIGNFTAPNAINIPRHKYLCQILGNKNMGGTIYGYGGSATFDDAAIITSQQEGQLQLVPRIKQETEIGTIIDETIFFRISDLTLMFGAGNEPTTVEEYYERKPIVADESAYNEGQLAGFGPTWGVKCQTPDGATTSTKHFDISSIFPHGLNKVGSVRDEMYYDSARRTWVAVHRVGVADLGTLEWTKQDRPDSIITWRFYSSELADMVPGVIYNFTCTKYKADISPVGNEDTDKTIASYYRELYVIDTSYSDAATFKAAMQGVLLCYELAEPVIEDVPFFDSFYNAYEGGTEEIVADTPTTAMDANIAYQYDDRGRIDFIYSKIKNL